MSPGSDEKRGRWFLQRVEIDAVGAPIEQAGIFVEFCG